MVYKISKSAIKESSKKSKVIHNQQGRGKREKRVIKNQERSNEYLHLQPDKTEKVLKKAE